MLVPPSHKQLNIFSVGRGFFFLSFCADARVWGVGFEMAKKKDRLEWGGYLNVRLTQDQHHQFDLWRAEMGDDVWDLFLQVLRDGMKISIVYDADIDTYTVSLMNSPKCPCGVSSLYVLSGYAQEWYTAVAVTLFKHFQILGGTWEHYRPSRPMNDKIG